MGPDGNICLLLLFVWAEVDKSQPSVPYIFVAVQRSGGCYNRVPQSASTTFRISSSSFFCFACNFRWQDYMEPEPLANCPTNRWWMSGGRHSHSKINNLINKTKKEKKTKMQTEYVHTYIYDTCTYAHQGNMEEKEVI